MTMTTTINILITHAHQIKVMMLYKNFQDASLNLSDDNRNFGESFPAIKSAQTPINISQHNTNDMISGHIIFNQVGNCTIRINRSIGVTSRQKHCIQNPCAKTPGQAYPLLQPEAGLIPKKILYIISIK